MKLLGFTRSKAWLMISMLLTVAYVLAFILLPDFGHFSTAVVLVAYQILELRVYQLERGADTINPFVSDPTGSTITIHARCDKTSQVDVGYVCLVDSETGGYASDVAATLSNGESITMSVTDDRPLIVLEVLRDDVRDCVCEIKQQLASGGASPDGPAARFFPVAPGDSCSSCGTHYDALDPSNFQNVRA